MIKFLNFALGVVTMLSIVGASVLAISGTYFLLFTLIFIPVVSQSALLLISSLVAMFVIRVALKVAEYEEPTK